MYSSGQFFFRGFSIVQVLSRRGSRRQKCFGRGEEDYWHAWSGGTRAGQQASEQIESSPEFHFPEISDWQYQHEPVDPALIAQDWLTIRHTVWNYVGLIRSERRLNRALRILSELDLEIGISMRTAR
ncbi:MAG TPA: hypothetical protein VMT53_22965 [Terriglobales bacterium]|nr:hypothetical protein [Terriglobales bacterium]